MARITDAVAARQAAPVEDFDDDDYTFRPATKERIKARIALYGLAGGGKTYTAIGLASTLGTNLAVIDTENRSASKYVGVNGWQFETLPMRRYDPRRLVKALASAASSGFDVVVVDSLTHFWKGTEGTLEQVDKAKSKYGGNSFAGWKDGTPIQNSMIDALMTFPGHVIVTMRSKTEWVITENAQGRKEPTRIGMKPEQREGIEYEFDIVGDIDKDNVLTVIKSRCPGLDNGDIIPKPGPPVAHLILAWLNDGAEAVDPATFITAATAEDATYDGLRALYGVVDRRGLLATPMLDPADDRATSLGEYIRARGSQLNAAGGAQ